MEDIGVPLSRNEMKKIVGGRVFCMECTSLQNPTLATFYCDGIYSCYNQTMEACQGQINCECHTG
jgi:hypothetical protein